MGHRSCRGPPFFVALNFLLFMSKVDFIIGRSLTDSEATEFLQFISRVARRYETSHQNVLGETILRFRIGISLTGREGRVLMGLLAQEMFLPLPLRPRITLLT